MKGVPLKASLRLETQEKPLLSITSEPQVVGRAPSCSVPLDDPLVSWHHLLVWAEAGRVWVRDLGSTNGTFLGGARLIGSHPVGRGSSISLGGGPVLIVETSGEEEQLLSLELVDAAGVVHPIVHDRFLIGSLPDADLVIDGPPRAATLLFQADGENVLGLPDGTAEQVTLGEPFDVCGHELLLRRCTVPRSPTVPGRVRANNYELEAMLAPKPVARLTDDSGSTHTVNAERRATLLYVLGDQLLQDRDRGLPSDFAGWCDDEHIALALWGRDWRNLDVNRVNVLLHRLRKELAGAGLDPWFLEKQQGRIRARLGTVTIRSDHG